MRNGRCAFCRLNEALPCNYCGANTCNTCHHGDKHLRICPETRRRETSKR